MEISTRERSKVKFMNGPVEKVIFGEIKKGYALSILKEVRCGQVDECGAPWVELYHFYQNWEIYPEGKVHYWIKSSGEPNIQFEGHFVSSKYEEYVNQMKQNNIEWTKELGVLSPSYYGEYND